VTPLTFQTLSRNQVFVDQFALPEAWKPEHVALAESADLVVVAPASANTLAKMRYGIADNLLTSVLLAAKAPIAVAPAMNSAMWENPSTQENVQALEERGVRIVGPERGELACAASGNGRMVAPVEIFKELQ
jgi:phosphopantothenoylcysteine decarboxylase/phosphopantothenate--cysteine ligase